MFTLKHIKVLKSLKGRGARAAHLIDVPAERALPPLEVDPEDEEETRLSI